MTRRGRILFGALLLVAAAVTFVAARQLAEAAQPRPANPGFPFADWFLATRLPIAAVALGLSGVLIGLLPAGRSPHRLLISGLALAAAPLPIVLNRDFWTVAGTASDSAAQSVPQYVSGHSLSLTTLVTAAVVAALLVIGAAVVAGLNIVTALVSLGALATLGTAGLFTPTPDTVYLAFVSAEALLLLGWSARLAGDRRGWPRTAVVTVLAFLASSAVYVIATVPGAWNIALRPPIPALSTDTGYGPPSTGPGPVDVAVIGVLLGLIAVGAAVLSRPWTGAAGVLSGQTVETAPVRRFLGGAFTLSAIGFWALGLANFEPALRATYDGASAGARSRGYFGGADMMEAIGLAGKDFRWAAIILGVGGVLLMVSGANRRTVAALVTVVGWLAADVLGDRANRHGLVFGLIAMAVVAAVVIAAVVIANRVPPGPQRPVGLRVVYGAVAMAVAPLLAYVDGGEQYLPAGMTTSAGVLSIALAAAGVIVAVTAAPRRSVTRVVIAIVVGGLAVAALSWRYWNDTSFFWTSNAQLAFAWYLAGLVFAVVALGLDRSRTWDAWLVLVLAALATPSLARAAVLGAAPTSYVAEDLLSPLTGDDSMYDGYPMVVMGAFAGLMLALLLVGPAAWWGRASSRGTASLPGPAHPAAAAAVAAGSDDSRQDDSRQDDSRQDDSRQDDSRQDDSRQDDSRQDDSRQDDEVTVVVPTAAVLPRP